MKSFTKEYEIAAPIEKVWECLTSAELMEKWGAAPATYENNDGGRFTMWGDYLEGEVKQMEAPRLLVQDWLVEGMDEPSAVTFRLAPIAGGTSVTLEHSDIPDELADELNGGWDEHYLGMIKSYLETNQ